MWACIWAWQTSTSFLSTLQPFYLSIFLSLCMSDVFHHSKLQIKTELTEQRWPLSAHQKSNSLQYQERMQKEERKPASSVLIINILIPLSPLQQKKVAWHCPPKQHIILCLSVPFKLHTITPESSEQFWNIRSTQLSEITEKQTNHEGRRLDANCNTRCQSQPLWKPKHPPWSPCNNVSCHSSQTVIRRYSGYARAVFISKGLLPMETRLIRGSETKQ